MADFHHITFVSFGDLFLQGPHTSESLSNTNVSEPKSACCWGEKGGGIPPQHGFTTPSLVTSAEAVQTQVTDGLNL